jgi:hypothetical protein
MLRTIAALCCLAALTGCPDYDENVEPPPEPWDGGIRPDGGRLPPIGCRQGVCGDQCCPGFPGSFDGQDQGTGVLWLFRTDRSLANLAPSYEKMATSARKILNAAGFDVRVTAAGSLYDGTLFWSGSETGGFAETLRLQAASAEAGMPVSCTTSGLATLTKNLRTTPVEGTELRPFESGVSALLVVLVDHGDRPQSAFGDACKVAGIRSFDYFSAPTTSWVDGMSEPRLNTRFLLIHTGEQVTFEDYRNQCAAVAQFPDEALDSVEPSEVPFFGDFTTGMNGHQPNLAQSVDLCAAAGSLGSAAGNFASVWARELIDAMPEPTGPLPPTEPTPPPDAGTP